MNLFRPVVRRSKTRHKLALTACAAVILAQPITPTFAANPDFSISQAESVEVTQELKAGQVSMSFSGFGQTFNLSLRKNDALMKNYSSRLRNVELYAGTIDGVHGSWARISKVNGSYTGAIYDGYELYMIDDGAMTAESVDPSMQSVMQHSETVMYKASGVSSELTCGSHDKDHSHAKFSYKDLVSELKSRATESGHISTADASANATATRQVNLSIVADTQYVGTSPNGAEAQVLSQMNIVDGIFSEQVGVQFGISEIRVLDNNGPLTSTNASRLLGQYRTFVGNNNPGLSHLFTGKNIDGNVIGIAFLSAICTQNGVGVTQAGGRGTLGALTAAHEFGHNFGAPHDNQGGSACASSPSGFLMNPSLNGSDQFSQCSLRQIENTLARRSACLVDVAPDPDPVPPPPPPPAPDPDPVPPPPPPPAPDPDPVPPPAPDPDPVPAPDPDPSPGPITDCEGTTNFARGASGFSFVDDAQSPTYTAGSASNGSLNVVVGGVDNADIRDMEGAWQGQCNSSESGPVTISVNASMAQASDYEANEFSQIAVRVNGDQTVFATLTGNGNGGATQRTGMQQFTATARLAEGVNTIDLVCSNNLKTFFNEVTRCDFTSIEIEAGSSNTPVPNPTPSPDEDVVNANFNSGEDGFSFEGDSSDPAYAMGKRLRDRGVDNTGSLSMLLGGMDNADINDIEANWVHSFRSNGGELTLSLDANLIQARNYEADESSEIGIKIDGRETVLNRVVGNGNGGNHIGTGLKSYTVPLNLGSGEHRISLFCRNSKKTYFNEMTRCIFDNVVIK